MSKKTFEPQSPTAKTVHHKAGKMEMYHTPSDHEHAIIAKATSGGSAKPASTKGGYC